MSVQRGNGYKINSGKHCNCAEEKLNSLKQWFIKSLGRYNKVDGCIKNGWVSINIQRGIAKGENFY